MRTAETVQFVVKGDEVYNDSTGNYDAQSPVKTPFPALVSDTGTQRMNLLYGGIKQRAKTIRLNTHYREEFDYVEIDGRKYQVDTIKKYQHKMTLEVSGI